MTVEMAELVEAAARTAEAAAEAAEINPTTRPTS
jgi:hypothetical protein